MNVFKRQVLKQLGIALGVVALAIVIAQIMTSQTKATAAKIQSQKSELVFRARATESLAALRSDSDKAEPLFNILNGALPPKDRLINFGPNLIDLAKQNGISLGFNFGTEEPAVAGRPNYIRFAVTGNSSYSNIIRFLQDLEKSRLFIKINSMDVTRQGGLDRFNFIADGQVYYQ